MKFGIDIGSTTIKAVLLNADHSLNREEILPTGNAPQPTAQALWKKFGAPKNGIATGYGRHLINFTPRQITEISAHARGVHLLHPSARTLIDVGGQDSKIIRLDQNGKVSEFAMNDKCAAGTGCFLANLAHRFNLPLNEFSAITTAPPMTLSSTCAVFAESEIVGLLSAGIDWSQITAGVHFAVAERIARLYTQVHGEPPIFFSGGGAQNKMLHYALTKTLNQEITIADHAQVIGAIGAAIS